MMELPGSIIISPYVYEIRFVDELRSTSGDELYGQIDYPETIIRLNKRYDDSQRMPAMLWHEILHGILEVAGVEKQEGKIEKMIRVLSPGIVQVIRDNKWIGEL